ncbi:MAG: metallopeptidase family protein [bacterium]|nr:metallopeptidase family protein [bacterium]
MVAVPQDRFEALVAQALDEIPDDLAELMENVAVLVADEGDDPDVWGLYDGVPLTDRVAYGAGEMVLPDRIYIYRLPICEGCSSEAEVVEEVRVTVIHEVAHHFGIEDERLDELGWG